jgi:hypothetical protein
VRRKIRAEPLAGGGGAVDEIPADYGFEHLGLRDASAGIRLSRRLMNQEECRFTSHRSLLN